MSQQAPEIINIAIGGGRETDEIGDAEITQWRLVDTDAPKEYDGFGTFTVHQYEGSRDEWKRDSVRVVLIREEHFGWQTTRYASGLQLWKPSAFDSATISEVLWKRLRGVEQSEGATNFAINKAVQKLDPKTDGERVTLANIIRDAIEEARS